MLLLLQGRGRVTAQALADEFEISIRTVYRDGARPSRPTKRACSRARRGCG
ncbi:HTH domain-containing protein [Paraburkholderia kururiensis]|uniref:HTH domain-containing protein n=1 Tax=Paraburkholderia kururiensis TaxID=984307 RepID=UPI0034E283EF